MAKTGVRDVYVNRAFDSVTMSAANTLTFAQIQFGVGLFQGVAAIIHRLEFFPDEAGLEALVANTDTLEYALTNRDDLSSLDPSNQSVFCYKRLSGQVSGAPATGWINEVPYISDYAELPGGGLIVPANPLYIGATSAGLVNPVTVQVIIYLTFKQLSDAEYVELVQTIMPANI